jgi:hypothetical protein
MSKYLEGCRRRLEDAALNYARAEALGSYIDKDGNRVSFCGSDRTIYLENFTRQMQQAARDILMEMTASPLMPMEKERERGTEATP